MKMHSPAHPGSVLRQSEMEPRKLSVSALAEAIQVSRKHLSQVVNGHARITPDLAVRLARAFRTSPDLWINMQAEYDRWEAERMAPHNEIKPLAAPKAAKA